jgi:CheY-like chemotaxis protein
MARIVVIEDDPDSMELMVYLLQAFGHQPVEATDGLAGLEAVAREQPDLVLCDIQLPRLDGREVAHRLKKDPALRRIPLVAVTALAMLGDRSRMLDAGFDGYLSKPIDPQRFVGQVEAFLPAAAQPTGTPP